jgi:hypothetical protein
VTTRWKGTLRARGQRDGGVRTGVEGKIGERVEEEPVFDLGFRCVQVRREN